MHFKILFMEKIAEVNLTEKIKDVLSKYGSTQRWLVGKLNENGIEMSDTKLSNRMTGVLAWTEEEIKLITPIIDSLL